MDFSDEQQVERYGRQLILPEIGRAGQRRLAEARVALIGVGGLGSPVALYLAAAGVGRLGAIDPEPIELSNLHRQILYAADELGQAKVQVAQQRLQSLNPDVNVVPVQERLAEHNAAAILQGYDVVVDGSDNVPTRYLVNDACIELNRPLVHGAIIGFDGHLMTILPRRSACLRCVFPEPPHPEEIPSCQQAGVLGSVAGIIGSLMAHEALKLVLGAGEPLADRLLIFEGRSSRFREVPIRQAASCEGCGTHPVHPGKTDTTRAASCQGTIERITMPITSEG